jgi:hypothetical protein
LNTAARAEPPRKLPRGADAYERKDKERIVENFNIFDFQLSAEDIAAIAKLDSGQSAFFDHRDPEVVKRLSAATRRT